ncbi:MAG: 4-(cytidine 5'-diphospho)-2-C-methyl-D-erythritol kinase [Chloroflexi bacterium]|nr:4-(cytidine 5'-diphospho)-2-C-methyl-D-erythritol kinase [Chloroflexota bacterium]
MTSSTITCSAHAKINLTLEILGKRPDGYHEIASLMQALALHDQLTFTPAKNLFLRSNVAELETEDNLIFRAARLLHNELGVSKGAAVDLKKRIPLAAGLGGGSSDCAAALRALDELWNLGLSVDQLIELGSRLGSDVPFFFHGGTALVEGRGETVTPLPPFPFHWVVLVTPRVELAEKTRALYSKVTPAHYSSGERTLRLADRLRRGEPFDYSLLANAFLPILLDESPAVRACWERVLQEGANHVLLSGSGPTLYTLLRKEEDARALCVLLMDLDAQVELTTTTSLREPESIRIDFDP